MRIGHGYDVHRLEEGRNLILCGIDVPYSKGLLGHSDADVATHALMDAILGAAALGDIGLLFPDNDNKYKDIYSILLLKEVVEKIKSIGYTVSNADITIIAQEPKLRNFIEQMRKSISKACETDIDNINIKATTTEKLGFEGEGLAISAHAVVLIEKY